MKSVKNRHVICRLINIRLIAMIQLMVMVLLALPAYSYESAAEHDKQTVNCHQQTGDAAHDSCPCCPAGDENGGSDNCSACSHCSCYAPLYSLPSYRYIPSVGSLTVPESFHTLPDVAIPIFVPPQNLV